MVLLDFLLACTLGFRLIALLVHEHTDLVQGSHTPDGLRLEVLVGVARRACGRLVEVSSTVDFAVDSRVRIDSASLVEVSSTSP